MALRIWRCLLFSDGTETEATVRYNPDVHGSVGELAQAAASQLVPGGERLPQCLLALYPLMDSEALRCVSLRTRCQRAVDGEALLRTEFITDEFIREKIPPEKCWLVLKISRPHLVPPASGSGESLRTCYYFVGAAPHLVCVVQQVFWSPLFSFERAAPETLAESLLPLHVDLRPSEVAASREKTSEFVGERAGELPPTPPLPLALVDPLFGFVSDIADGELPSDLTADEFRIVDQGCSALVTAACGLYDNERARNQAILGALRALAGRDLVNSEADSAQHPSISDGTGFVLTAGGHRVFLVNLELKEHQAGQRAELQNICYYLQHYAPRNDLKNGGLPACLAKDLPLAPALLVNMYSGTMISIQAVALTRFAVLSEVLATSTLLVAPGSPQRTRLVHLLLGLRLGLSALSKRYADVPGDLSTPKVAPAVGVPLGTLIQKLQLVHADGKPSLHVTCGEPMMEGRLVFAASGVREESATTTAAPAVPERDKADLVVKFTRRYGTLAHMAAAEAGVAPHLHGVIRLAGGWIAVVMSNLKAKDGWRHLDTSDASQKAAALSAWRRGVKDRGFVHGDLRPPNILVRRRQVVGAAVPVGMAAAGSLGAASAIVDNTSIAGHEAWEVRFVDWDWAGETSAEVSYPLNRNPAIPWPSGSVAGGLILPDHDQACLER
jgi:hypothetical protein